MRRLLFASSTICLILSACTDHPCGRNAALDLGTMQQDILELRDHILQSHPLSFATEQDVRESFEIQHAKLMDSMTVLEFYRILSKAVSSVNCGHTRLSLPGCVQEDAYLNGNYVPLDIEVVHDSLVVLKDFTPEKTVPPGTNILSINGRQAKEIVKSIKEILPADGKNETYKYFQMNQDFNRRYVEALGEASCYEIVYITPESAESDQVTFHAITLAEMEELREALQTGVSDLQRMEFSTDDDSLYAILRIRFFGFHEDLDSFTDRINDFFQTLHDQQIGSLILDLRGNDGGEPYCAAYLLGYLIGEPFRYFALHSTFLYDELKDVQQIPDNPYKGELYVLVDGGCYSTTGHFLSLLRSYGKGFFIGEETGGSYLCNGGFREHRLAHSGIELLLPHTAFIADASGLERGSGITPDLFSGHSVDDVVNGWDPVLDTTLAIIVNRN